MRSVARYRPTRVLEIGPGIGTLSYSILAKMKSLALHECDDFLFVTVEDNEFCAQQLQKNLQEFDGLYHLCESIADLDPDLDFDLIIVDGGERPDDKKALIQYTDFMREHGMILVEGQRNRQQLHIRESQRPFIHRKMRSLRQNRLWDGTGIRDPRFKSYHVYLFEPSGRDRAQLIARSYSRRLGVNLLKRLSLGHRPA
jgi:protein-L-isoaspartate O-methyltransferase